MYKTLFVPRRVDAGTRKVFKKVEPYLLLTPELTVGDHATIYLAEREDSKAKVAMKVFTGTWLSQQKSKLEVALLRLQEYASLRIAPQLHHSALITATSIYFPMELCNCGSLYDYIKDGQTFGEPALKSIGVFLASALMVLHSRNLVHREINPRHILVHLDAKYSISYRLTGFLQAAHPAPSGIPPFIGNNSYNAPETKSGTGVSFACDVWSFGITMYELACGSTPLVNDSNYLTKLKRQLPLEYPTHILELSSDFKQLIAECLAIVPEERPTSAQLLSHPFLLGNSWQPALMPVSTTGEKPPTQTAFAHGSTRIPQMPKVPNRAPPTQKPLNGVRGPDVQPNPQAPPNTLETQVTLEENQLKLLHDNLAQFMEYTIARHPQWKDKLKVVKKSGLEPYEPRRHLGTGGFSEVDICVDMRTNKEYAMKTISASKMTDVKIAKLLIGEIEIMKDLQQSAFTIKLYDYFVVGNSLVLILEYCNGGDLDDYVKKHFRSTRDNQYLSIADLKLIARSTASGLRDMHALKMMHRDIKPKNILIIEDSETKKILKAKLCDYGLSRKVIDALNFQASTILGTFDYFAPELYAVMDSALTGEEGQKYDNKVDVWSYGATLYYAGYGKTLFSPPNSKGNVLKGILKFPSTPPLPEDYLDLIRRCLIFDPRKRPSFEEVLAHRFFTSSDFSTLPVNPHKLGQSLGGNSVYNSTVWLCSESHSHFHSNSHSLPSF